ncbi:MAG: globin [Gammaproteobacteria bacterium]|nr:globin [Gammaproteobacteria bacterium]NKB63198.1 globin [Gammaproteobacteria bacterium]
MQNRKKPYGTLDASYQAAGGYNGLITLVDRFYDYMDSLPEASVIREMHPETLDESKEKLARFLSGWLGGPKRYQEKYGPIRIPMVHLHLDVGAAERDAWLLCMEKALDDSSYDAGFKTYLLDQLARPAERIREVTENRRANESTPKDS